MIEARLVEWEETARSRLDPAAYEFFAAGAGPEQSAREAAEAWRGWRLRPRVLVDVSSVDTRCTLLGHELRSPILVAPTAFHVLAHDDGELASAAGAADAGSLYVMATRSTRLLEDVAAAAGDPWWFQVYVLRDRGLTRALVQRAVAAGARALVLTGDTPIVVPRTRGASIPLGEEQFLVNLRPHLPLDSQPTEGAAESEPTTQDPSITEESISWLADLSDLPVLVKGVLRPDDALRCLAAGAAGIVVSNHGGRQLDGAVPTATALRPVVRAVRESGSAAPVLVDGGIRDARSVLTALALGADAVMVGRPVIWALAAAGRAGVAELLNGLRDELAQAMMLAGTPDLASVNGSFVVQAGGLLVDSTPQLVDSTNELVGSTTQLVDSTKKEGGNE